MRGEVECLLGSLCTSLHTCVAVNFAQVNEVVLHQACKTSYDSIKLQQAFQQRINIGVVSKQLAMLRIQETLLH